MALGGFDGVLQVSGVQVSLALSVALFAAVGVFASIAMWDALVPHVGSVPVRILCIAVLLCVVSGLLYEPLKHRTGAPAKLEVAIRLIRSPSPITAKVTLSNLSTSSADGMKAWIGVPKSVTFGTNPVNWDRQPENWLKDEHAISYYDEHFYGGVTAEVPLTVTTGTKTVRISVHAVCTNCGGETEVVRDLNVDPDSYRDVP